MFALERMGKAIGAIVTGLDLREPLTDEVFAALRQALTDHQVLFFRDQELTEDQQRAFALRFGELSRDALAQFTGDTRDVLYLENTAERPPGGADRWHTDVAWVAEPPAYGILNAQIIPEFGGDTLWASLFAAYEALSPKMQAFCADLRVVNRASGGFLTAAMRAAGEERRVLEAFPPVEHPLVRIHPLSGRPALFITATMDQIVGLTRAESDALIGHFRSLLEDPNVQVRWRWRVHDLVIWDQASTNRRALSDYYPQNRKMRRCTVAGGPPLQWRAA